MLLLRRAARTRSVNSHPDNGMNRRHLPRFPLNLFHLDVERLTKGIGAVVSQPPILDHVPDHSHRLPVRVRLNASIQSRSGRPHLHVKCPRQEKSPKRQRPSQPGSTPREVPSSSNERSARDDPPQSGTPFMNSQQNSASIGDAGP